MNPVEKTIESREIETRNGRAWIANNGSMTWTNSSSLSRNPVEISHDELDELLWVIQEAINIRDNAKNESNR